MIDEVDHRLTDWIEDILGSTTVALSAPQVNAKGRGVGLYLMELAQASSPAGVRHPTSQISLRYLVTSWAEKVEEAHRVLGELLFEAIKSSDFEVELKPPPIEVWEAFGVVPQPSFILRTSLQRLRPQKHAPVVIKAPTLETVAITALGGRVLGPGGVPIAGAAVDIPDLRLSTRTDSKGSFLFSAVPAGRENEVRVSAKGGALVGASLYSGHNEALVIHLEGMEE